MCINITFGRGKISAYLTQNKTIEDKKLYYISGLKESLYKYNILDKIG